MIPPIANRTPPTPAIVMPGKRKISSRNNKIATAMKIMIMIILTAI
jgi:hypothetical protein